MKNIFKHLMLSVALAFCVCTYPAVVQKRGLYQQITPEILKNINATNPSDADTDLINACRAVNEFGTQYPDVTSEILQAINSIDMTRILSQYARNITVFGRIGLMTKIAQMTDNVETLKKKQALIKYFNQNPALAENFTKTLKDSLTAESKFLILFKKLSEQEKIDQKKDYDTVYFSTPPLAKLNEQKYTLETVMRARYATPIFHLASIFILPIVIDVYQNSSSDTIGSKISKATYNSILILPRLYDILVKLMTPVYGKNGARAYTALIVSMNAYMNSYEMLQSIKTIKGNLDLIYEKQKDLIMACHLIKSMQKISQTISNDNVLTTLMSEQHAKLSELFDPNSTQTSADLKHLIHELNSWSFQGSDSYLFSLQGKILATHHLLNRIKGELVPYLEAFGQVDANLAVFTLYQEFKNHPRVTFCLPEFIQSSTPTLQAHGYWHPLINPNYVVTNDVTMGQGTANLIITGPHAGGKTTSLMSLIINIIFAQSFGIAPSSSLRFTPFAKIHSYLDITTNLQEGLSLFAAEVNRAKKLKLSIQSCTPGQKTFTIIDEIFSGTNPEVASDVGFKFIQQLGEMPHSMAIITTHFPRLTALEKETKRFKNYKVADAIIAPNGAISYPFKLIQGASTQNIAQHMLRHEGII